MIEILCKTRFDITATGVKNHFNTNRMPFSDANGRLINDQATWNTARNQQRNWETVNQLISLRTLPVDISIPEILDTETGKWWQFTFTVETPSSIEIDGDTVGALVYDCKDIPMLTGLGEIGDVGNCLDPGQNIFFLVKNK